MKLVGEYIAIGENAKDNFALIDVSSKEHLWFHLDAYPSSHVVLQVDDPTFEMIERAATECIRHSKYRNLRKLKVIYTTIQNLRKEKTIGQVSFLSRRRCRYIVVDSIR